MNRTISAMIIAATVLSLGTAAYAADSEPATHTVTLRSGKVLTDAYILDKKPNGITVAYKDGAMFIPFSDNGAMKVTLNSFEANVDIPDYVFRKPEKLSALEGDKR